MEIRKAVLEDLDRMEEIYSHARKQMILNGNPTQWGNNRPPRNAVEASVKDGYAYVVLASDGHICGTFSFKIGEDPTYGEIYDGAWLRDAEYGAIHRVASDNSEKGVFGTILEFAKTFGVDLRIDTHENNTIMLHNVEKCGFTRCGRILTDDGTERIAFQMIVGEDHGQA